MKKFLTLLLLTTTLVSVAQESVLLRLNYKKGDSYVMNMKMSQDLGDVMSSDTNAKMLMDITEVSSKGYAMMQKFASISMNMSQGGMTMSYDSTKSDEELDDTGKMFKAQMGPILQVVITAKGDNLGNVTDVSIKPNIPQVSNLANQAGGVVYPEKAVRVGDTWKMNKSEAGLSIDFVYTVKSITRTNVLVDIKGKVSGLGTGNVTGNMDIDKKSGVPLTSVINMSVDAGGQTIVSKTTVTTTKK